MLDETPAVTRPALRYHGGKFRLAPWLMQFFPPHGCYVESFGGAAGVLLQKPMVYAEVYNDLDGDIVNFFRVLRDPRQRADLIEACRLTPYARDEFEGSYEPTDNPLERARRTAIRAAMGFGSAGATKATTGFRTDTLHFVDPPYVHETRVMRAKSGYRHELDDQAHRALLAALNAVDGMVVLCGYRCDLYDAELSGWERHDTEARISGGRGAAVRTESVWLNRSCATALHRARGDLFSGLD